MKKIFFATILLTLILAACGGGETPASTPDVETAANSQTESNPEATEQVEVKLEPQAGDTRTYVDGTTIVYVPAGEFTMGVKNGIDNPEHTASTDGYWIYSTEITNLQYSLCVSLGQCTSPDETVNPIYDQAVKSALPVTGVNFEQAQNYCTWIGGRLPTEMEWEKAARGTDALIYPWGNDAPACEKSNFSDCQKFSPDNVVARELGRSPYQLFDMAGNVFEWTQDWYDPEAYTRGITLNEQKVIRGGAFNSTAEELTTFARFSELPEVSSEDLGFRCVVENDAVLNAAPLCEMGLVMASDSQNADCSINLAVTGSYCKNGKPYANIKVTSTGQGGGWGNISPEAPGDCTFENNVLVCTGPDLSSFNVSLDNQCEIESKGVIGCPEGYEMQNEMCVLVGSNEPGVCPEGFNTDTSLQCCTVVAAPILPICPPGYGYKNGGYGYDDEPLICVLKVTGSAQVNLPACTIQDKPKEEEEPDPEPKPTDPPICVPGPTGGCP